MSAPTVSLTAPAAGAYVVAGSTVSLTAAAAAVAPATITSVEFFYGTTSIGTASAAPFTVSWTNVPAGEYSLSAVATDSNSNTTTSGAQTINVIPLRTDFPEFADTVTFPDSTINYWLNVASMMLIPRRWQQMLTVGIELFAAHNIVLEAYASNTVAVGGLPGLSKGAIAGEAVDKGSVSYDTNSTLELDGGNWNLTVYGSRFLRMARMFGAGPIQIGVGWNPNPLNGPAWGGPDCAPGWFGS